MIRLLLATAATFAVAVATLRADDAKPAAPKSTNPAPGAGKIVTTPSPYHPAGTTMGRVTKVSATDTGGSITVNVPHIEPNRISATGRLYFRKADRDTEFELAEDVKVRFGFRPKTVPPPDNLPGYKAEPSDLHAGQIVKLTLGKKAPPGANLNAVKSVVTMITIESDTAAARESKAGEMPKKKS